MQIRLCAMVLRSAISAPFFLNNPSGDAYEVPPLHDVTDTSYMHCSLLVKCDPMIRVRDLASSLVHAASDSAESIPECVHTLTVTDLFGRTWVADPSSTVAQSTITHGCCVRPHPDALSVSTLLHARPPVAQLSISNGQENAQVFLIREGLNSVGRDPTNDVCIPDSRISRLHAILRWEDNTLTVRDRGSSNGTTVLSQGHVLRITECQQPVCVPAQICFGGVRAELTRVNYSVEKLPAVHHVPFVPYRIPARSADEICVPDLPQDHPPQRFPIISALAPAAIGVTVYLATHSLMSLVGVAVSPLIVIATWCEQRWSRHRSRSTATQHFHRAFAVSEDQLTEFHAHERAWLCRLHPNAYELAARTMYELTSSSRSQSVDHTPILIRCGSGTVPSSALVKTPTLPHPATSLSSSIVEFLSRARSVTDAPVVIAGCVSALNIIGDSATAQSLLRSMLIQAAAQRKPKNLRVFFIAERISAQQAWSWAAWLPHVHMSQDSGFCSSFAGNPHEIAALLRVLHDHRRPSDAPDTEQLQTLLIVDAATPELASQLLTVMRSDPERMVTVWAHSENSVFPEFTGGTLIDLRNKTLHPASNEATSAQNTQPRPGGNNSTHTSQGLTPVPQVISVSSWESMSISEAVRSTVTLVKAHETHRQGLRSMPDESRTQQLPLPASVNLNEMFPYSELRSAALQVDHWHRKTSTTSPRELARTSTPPDLAAVVGLSSSGPIKIDLRKHGPHALVAGTTGSGKSEFLQSWIFSLATTHPPDRLVFFLMDYKGGAAFSECEYLPHIVGYMTDLTASLARRAHAALSAEIVFRERLLHECGASDIESLELRNDHRAPPNLIVVVDECAVLLREHPPARDVLHDIAQRGRSLGMHLILATQRPSGVISDQLRANTSIRVSLRVADVGDSIDLLGGAQAANISHSLPGRAYLRIGSDDPIGIQTAFVGARKRTGEVAPPTLNKMVVCGTRCESPTRVNQAEIKKAPFGDHQVHATDATKIRDRLLAAAAHGGYELPRKLWCDPLPIELTVSQLLGPQFSALRQPAPEAIGIVPRVGLIDLPHEQRQQQYGIPLTQEGHVLVTGAARSGKSTTLSTIAAQVLHVAPATWLYTINSHPFTDTEACQDVINVHDYERLKRAFALFATFLTQQQHTDIRPHVLIVIDDLISLREALESRPQEPESLRTFHELLRHGRTSGISIAAGSERLAALPAAWLSGFPSRICHRISDLAETHLTGLVTDASIVSTLPPGRALVQHTKGHAALEVQIAHADLPQGFPNNQNVWPVAPNVPVLPKRLSRAALEAQYPGLGYFAYDLTAFVPLAVPSQGLCIVTGRAGSGRSQTIKSIVEAANNRARYRGSPFTSIALTAPHSARLTNHAFSAQTTDITVAESLLRRALKQQHHAVLVLESGAADAAVAVSLPTLCAALPKGVLVVYEAAYRMPAESWTLKTYLRAAPYVLALQPDPLDPPCVVMQSLSRFRSDESPQGRGVWITGNRITQVQLAWPEESDFSLTRGAS